MHHIERLSYPLIVLAVVLIGMAVGAVLFPKNKTTSVYIGNIMIKASVATDDAQRNTLLEEEDALKENTGVLAAYNDEEDVHTFSAEILSTKTDILWLNEKQKVVHQAERIIPMKKSRKQIGPEEPVKYVLFLREGTIGGLHIRPGSKIDFNLHSLW